MLKPPTYIRARRALRRYPQASYAMRLVWLCRMIDAIFVARKETRPC